MRFQPPIQVCLLNPNNNPLTGYENFIAVPRHFVEIINDPVNTATLFTPQTLLIKLLESKNQIVLSLKKHQSLPDLLKILAPQSSATQKFRWIIVPLLQGQDAFQAFQSCIEQPLTIKLGYIKPNTTDVTWLQQDATDYSPYIEYRQGPAAQWPLKDASRIYDISGLLAMAAFSDGRPLRDQRRLAYAPFQPFRSMPAPEPMPCVTFGLDHQPRPSRQLTYEQISRRLSKQRGYHVTYSDDLLVPLILLAVASGKLTAQESRVFPEGSNQQVDLCRHILLANRFNSMPRAGKSSDYNARLKERLKKRISQPAASQFRLIEVPGLNGMGVQTLPEGPAIAKGDVIGWYGGILNDFSPHMVNSEIFSHGAPMMRGLFPYGKNFGVYAFGQCNYIDLINRGTSAQCNLSADYLVVDGVPVLVYLAKEVIEPGTALYIDYGNKLPIDARFIFGDDHLITPDKSVKKSYDGFRASAPALFKKAVSKITTVPLQAKLIFKQARNEYKAARALLKIAQENLRQCFFKDINHLKENYASCCYSFASTYLRSYSLEAKTKYLKKAVFLINETIDLLKEIDRGATLILKCQKKLGSSPLKEFLLDGEEASASSDCRKVT